MDEDFEYFFKDSGFGPAIDSRKVDASYAEKYRGKLPDQLIRYWLEHGWCGYGEGLFWTVDPEDYEDILDAWLDDTPLVENDAYYVIARSAFGKLLLWGTKTGQSITIEPFFGGIYPTDGHTDLIKNQRADDAIRFFFSVRKKKNLDFTDANEKPLFARALKKFGALAYDEMYGFEPALCIGGEPKLGNLAKVKIVEHLLILAQLGDRQIMENPYLKALNEQQE